MEIIPIWCARIALITLSVSILTFLIGIVSTTGALLTTGLAGVGMSLVVAMAATKTDEIRRGRARRRR